MTEATSLLIDTSAWVRYLRRGNPPGLTAAIREALAAGLVATCPVVSAELLQGCLDDRSFRALQDVLSGLIEVAVSVSIWRQAARLGYTLRRRGLTIGLPDLLIAQCAITSNRVLWHADAHFEQIRQHAPLQTRMWELSS